jgi:uncharacterized protein
LPGEIPQYKIKINNIQLEEDVIINIVEITVINKINAPSTCLVRINDTEMKFIDSKNFKEGSEIEVNLGFGNNTGKIFQGDLTGFTAKLSISGGCYLLLKGHGLLHRLNRAKKIRSFVKLTESDIIKKMAGESGMMPNVETFNSVFDFKMQKDQTDFEYILTQAQLHNCIVYSDNKNFYFKNLNSRQENGIKLNFGIELLDFNIDLDTTKLVNEVEVRGWNVLKQEKIVGKATTSNVTKKIGGNKAGVDNVKSKFTNAKASFAKQEISDLNRAKDLAACYLTDNSLNYINATGKCIGNNKIKAGEIIEIAKIGEKYSGKYFVRKVKHVFNINSGYYTFVDLQRNCN